MTTGANQSGSRSPFSLALVAGGGFVFVYLIALAGVSSFLPLRADEILPLYAFQTGTWHKAMSWIASLPGATPGFSISQWPLVAVTGHTPLISRIVSVLCAAAAVPVLWQIANFAGLRNRIAAVVVFAALPVQFVSATTARPPEESLLFFVFATLIFLRLAINPWVLGAVSYGLLLTATIYTNPFAYASAVGYLLFFFRFVSGPVQRRAIWFILPATVIPLLLYVPYYFWAAPQSGPNTLGAPSFPASLAEQIWTALAGDNIVSYAAFALICFGAIAALWPSFQPRFPVAWSNAILHRNISIFVFLGGAVAAVAFAGAYASVTYTPVNTAQVITALPLLVLTFFCAAEFFGPARLPNILPPVLAVLLITASVIEDVRFTQAAQTPNLQALADAAWPALSAPDSCVVLVSEGLSRPLFFVLSPNLKSRECHEFYHKTVILEIHPYVRANQREDAISFFRGLNFQEVKRQEVGGGSVITMSQQPPR